MKNASQKPSISTDIINRYPLANVFVCIKRAEHPVALTVQTDQLPMSQNNFLRLLSFFLLLTSCKTNLAQNLRNHYSENNTRI